ncbi:unnamed protein product [Caenorhabditis angaria]|uniref:Uncharacterized protein n=1 Tax=Caenorhabditis angaria TaxID=860376 RepID=A0A9P1IP71_9PELO|nr:unnamed protein product [Caenorhabditis angaria]
MVAKAELGSIFKYVMIGLGVLHLLIGILAVVECVREGIAISDMFPTSTASSVYNTMLPSPFAPFLVGAVCLVFAFIPIYYILFAIILLDLIEIGLFVWPMISVLQMEDKKTMSGIKLVVAFQLTISGASSAQTTAASEALKSLEGIYVFNKVVCGMGIFAAVATIPVAGFLAFKNRPGGGGGSFSSTQTS